MKYVCVKPCWYGGKKWRLGESDEFPDDVIPSKHLQPEKRKPGRPPKEVVDSTLRVESPIEVKVNKETRIK